MLSTTTTRNDKIVVAEKIRHMLFRSCFASAYDDGDQPGIARQRCHLLVHSCSSVHIPVHTNDTVCCVFYSYTKKKKKN